ncbi:MAG: DNA/RNA nuclease SfsA [Fusobacteria bacterium]|nr:DNA/RNA nuclease SfsA [Fusobacteriota bacterium]
MTKLIEIKYDYEGKFINRINRYVGEVLINGEVELVHVHDPGRLKELLYEGNIVYIRKASNPDRKTKYDMIAAKKQDEIVLINSAFHRKINEAILENSNINPIGKIDSYRAEVKYNKSRLDFLIQKDGKQIWLETKGCTLSIGDTAYFPDAPTERGRRHLLELIDIVEQGEDGMVYINVLTNAEYFSPNYETDINFYNTFYEALDKGVKIFPILCKYENQTISYVKILKIKDKIIEKN